MSTTAEDCDPGSADVDGVLYVVAVSHCLSIPLALVDGHQRC